MKSIKRNYLYNLSYQILVILAPLITAPYVSRVLREKGVGIYSYTDAWVSYFVLLATLGIATFGQREISYVQNDKLRRSQVFWETKALEAITGTIALIAYLIFALNQKDYQIIYLILACNILSVIFDVVWFFAGMEEFGKIVGRNFVIKILSIAYIFIFVKTKDDLWIYVFGNAFFALLGNLSLWPFLRKYVNFPVLKEIKPFRNIKTVIALFIPTVAIQIYTYLDKTMIGVIIRANAKNGFYKQAVQIANAENGYYDRAIVIARITLTITTSLGTVMIPRIGAYFNKGDKEQIKESIYKVINFVWCIAIPLAFGLIGISSNLVPWFLGPGYDKVVPLLKILSFIIIAIGISNVTGLQFLIPTKREREYTYSVVVGAAINFVLNLILIRSFMSMGAAVASVLAEIAVTTTQLYMVRKELPVGKILMTSKNYLISSLIMLAGLLVIGGYLKPSIINTVAMVVLGACVYAVCLLILRDKFFINTLKSIFKRRK